MGFSGLGENKTQRPSGVGEKKAQKGEDWKREGWKGEGWKERV